ncbi:hypothetical protein, partial [Prevotella nigrescens]|uniref:hypothetical protein n=1 Tax=Prevotella nigrescens TaxID=28133 RepID=UPI00241D4FDE
NFFGATALCLCKVTARYVFSRSKYFEHPGKRLALAGGGLSLRSRKAFQNCGAVIRSGGLCRQSAKSKVI